MRRVLLLGVIAGLLLVPAADAHSLSQAKAMRALQKKADAYAGQPTKILVLERYSRHKYFAIFRWEKIEQVVCQGCGFDGVQPVDEMATQTSRCSVGIYVRFRSRSSRRLVYRFREPGCKRE